jgi:hypothetical protein
MSNVCVIVEFDTKISRGIGCITAKNDERDGEVRTTAGAGL